MGHKSNNISANDEWSTLAIKAQNGDKISYNSLLLKISLYAKNYLISRVANPDWVDDITQEVLISIHKSLHTYSPDRPFKPWFMAIVNFRKTDFLRKHYSSRSDMQTSLDNVDFIKSHVTNAPHAGELKDIEGALEKLPEKQRKIFELIKIKGYTAKEAAKELNMSISAVKVSAHRTTKKLKKTLGNKS